MAKKEEEKQETRHLRDLRKQLIKVKRENAELRKRNYQLEGMLIEVEEAALEQEEERFNKNIKHEKEGSLTCPACRSKNVGELMLRGMKYYNCIDCGSRGKVK